MNSSFGLCNSAAFNVFLLDFSHQSRFCQLLYFLISTGRFFKNAQTSLSKRFTPADRVLLFLETTGSGGGAAASCGAGSETPPLSVPMLSFTLLILAWSILKILTSEIENVVLVRKGW